jgi:hypothetical protein
MQGKMQFTNRYTHTHVLDSMENSCNHQHSKMTVSHLTSIATIAHSAPLHPTRQSQSICYIVASCRVGFSTLPNSLFKSEMLAGRVLVC